MSKKRENFLVRTLAKEATGVTFVGMTRLELATTRPPDVYANQLRYIPKSGAKVLKKN